MEHMHWNYWEYIATPAPVLRQIQAFINTEAKYYASKTPPGGK